MSIKDNYFEIMENIESAAAKAGRKADDITMLAVSKFIDEQRIKEAIALGAKHCGESRAQELTAKLSMFREFDIDVHFIGQMQTNKVKYVIGQVSTIQSMDRIELAKEISRQGAKLGIVQPVLVEVNIGDEPQKGGAPAQGLEGFLTEISALPNIFVKGLMCIPPAAEEREAQAYFAKMKRLFEDAKDYGLPNVSMDILSMGMSGDYRAAIAEGATMVRIGSALFGQRSKPGGVA